MLQVLGIGYITDGTLAVCMFSHFTAVVIKFVTQCLTEPNSSIEYLLFCWHTCSAHSFDDLKLPELRFELNIHNY